MDSRSHLERGQRATPYLFDRDVTSSRFVDTDAIFGNGFGGLYDH